MQSSSNIEPEMVESSSSKQECLERAAWYIERIDDLIRLMQDKPRLDGDDVEQCQSMLREILARFRCDKRPPAEGRVVSMLERNYLWAVAEAGETVRVAATSRPTGRWRDDLTACRAKMAEYHDRLAQA